MSQPCYTPEDLSAAVGTFPPTEEQSQVISAPLSPLLVVAGAGSGKTATMSDRVVWLVANGMVAPDEVLGVTFTRKAAGELAHRINRKLELLSRAGLPLPGVQPVDGVAGSDGSAGPVSAGMDDTVPGRATVSTYHSYANTLVQDHGMRLGLEPDTELIGEAQAFQIVSRLVRACDADLGFTDVAASTLISGVIRLAGDCAEHLTEPEQVIEFLDEVVAHGQSLPLPENAKGKPSASMDTLFESLLLRRVMADLVTGYQQAKWQAGVMDYGDLVRYAARICREIPDVGRIERERNRVVLLDEFQDTSHAQLELFGCLYGQDSGHTGHPVTAVGDPNQSIYGFRGASAGQLFSFPSAFPRNDADGGGLAPAPVSYLSTAWRNSRSVLEAANTISAPLRRDQTGAGTHIEVPALTVPAQGEVAQGQVRLAWYPDSAQEAESVVEALEQARRDHDAQQGAQQHAQRGAVAGGQDAPCRLTRAVLCRKRSQFAPLMEVMDRAGVPYEVLGLSGLLALPEVADVITVLQVIADPTRSDALMRILTGPRWRIGPADLMVLQHRARALADGRTLSEDAAEDRAAGEDAEASSLVEALDHLPPEDWQHRDGTPRPNLSPAGRQRLAALARELRFLAGQTGSDLVTLIQLIERTLGLDIEVTARPGDSRVTARRHLDAFLDTAAQFTRGSPSGTETDLLAFLAWLDAAAEQENGLGISGAEPNPEAVQLLTMHAAKGLEWDAVAVPGLVEPEPRFEKKDHWTGRGNGALPWDLRGDRHSLPQWDRDWPDRRDWADSALKWALTHQKQDYPPAYPEQVLDHGRQEDRRLAYVAFTRAKTLLLLSGSHWRGTNKTPQQPSTYLQELREVDQLHEPSPVTITSWVEPDELEETNPRAGRMFAAPWPFDPLEGPEIYEVDPEEPERLKADRRLPPRSIPRRRAVKAASNWVREAMCEHTAAPAVPEATVEPVACTGDAELDRRIEWVRLRAGRHSGAGGAVELPSHLSTSAFVDLAGDPGALARQLRRPMPRPPARAARRGTAFHAWVEEHFAQLRPGTTAMLDFDDPLEAADHWVDDALDVGPMREVFMASRWAERVPASIEAPVETTIGGITLRGRIDAVYRDGGDPADPYAPDARWELIDWKTGSVPQGRDLRVKGLQLAVYRLAWSRLHRIPLENISASFVYVAHGVERSLHDLAGEAELERILADSLNSGG